VGLGLRWWLALAQSKSSIPVAARQRDSLTGPANDNADTPPNVELPVVEVANVQIRPNHQELASLADRCGRRRTSRGDREDFTRQSAIGYAASDPFALSGRRLNGATTTP